MNKKIVVFGGSFNPPSLHHVKMVEELKKLKIFDRIIIVPCGPRPDKETTNDIDPIFRAAMNDKTFGEIQGVEIDHFDLENNVFTRTHDLQDRYAKMGEVWHVVGSEFISNSQIGQSFIQQEWENGNELWNALNFVVFRRGKPIDKNELPPKNMVIEFDNSMSSSIIRNKCFNHEIISGLVTSEVEEYILRIELYRGRLPRIKTELSLNNIDMKIIYDSNNPKAVKLARKLQRFEGKNPKLIIVIGGDGTLIRVAKKYLYLRLPIMGINAGHRGYLLNECLELPEKLIVHHLPLLDIEARMMDGKIKKIIGFNDAWAKILSGQSAWFNVLLNNEKIIRDVRGDGFLVSTAAGSTGYAKNITGFSLPPFSREMIMAGMYIDRPRNWKDTPISEDTEIMLSVNDSKKRPMTGFVDGVKIGKIQSMEFRNSKTASIELGFLENVNLVEKHMNLSLPYLENLNF